MRRIVFTYLWVCISGLLSPLVGSSQEFKVESQLSLTNQIAPNATVDMQSEAAEKTSTDTTGSAASSASQNIGTSQPEVIDQTRISEGGAAFIRNCTSCHDAQRALGKSKSYSG